MIENNEQEYLYADLVERVKREQSFSTILSIDNIYQIFLRQAIMDTSGDLPVLLPEFKIEITADNKFSLYAPYTIDADKKSLIVKGTAENNNEGILTDDIGITVLPDSQRKSVIDAFDGKSDLPNFVRLIIEDAFRGVAVNKLWVTKEGLGVTLEHRP